MIVLSEFTEFVLDEITRLVTTLHSFVLRHVLRYVVGVRLS